MNDIASVYSDVDKSLRVIEMAAKVLARASGMLANADRPDCTGGYLSWTDAHGTPFIAGLMWGAMPLEKAAKRREVALEKATRLARYPTHQTSYRTRNPRAGRWGGAIRAGEHILSFSGFPEQWDEAAMFVLAIKLGWLGSDDVFRRISPKRNPHLRPLFQACHWTE